MKLKEGNKYNIEFRWGTLEGTYFAGGCDALCGRACDHCGRELENGYIFMDPSTPETSYEDCEDGACKSSYFVGKTCIKKVKITEAK